MKASVILMRRIGGALWPAEEKAAEAIRRLKIREPVAIRIMRTRSAAQNSLYWRVLNRVVEATGRWRTAQELHLALKVATGHVDVVALLDGRRVLVPQSTSFDSMTQDEAQAYYDAAFRIVAEEIMGGMSVDQLLEHAAPDPSVNRAA